MFLFPIPILHLPKTISLKPFYGYQWLLGYRIRPKLLSLELKTLIPDPMYYWIFFRTCSVLWYLHVLTCKVLFQLTPFFPHSPPVKYSTRFSSPVWNLPPLKFSVILTPSWNSSSPFIWSHIIHRILLYINNHFCICHSILLDCELRESGDGGIFKYVTPQSWEESIFRL